MLEKLPILGRALRDSASAAPDWLVAGLTRRSPPWVFVTENAEWSIRHDGEQTLAQLRRLGIPSRMTEFPYMVRDAVLHFGSLNVFRPAARCWGSYGNKVVLTCFHGDYGIEPAMDQRLDLVRRRASEINRLVVSNELMRERFLRWGFPSDRLRLIPVGVDLHSFQPSDEATKKAVRTMLGIPEHCHVIGSFQKDGVGWGDGHEPKLIKGPDVFCDVVESLATRLPIHVLLTGPARGYVKSRLSRAGIGFTHHFLPEASRLPDFYAALDLYLMCSREEGGPKAVSESLASGVPLVATKTGMAADLAVENPAWPWLCDVGDVDALTRCAEEALTVKDAQQTYRAMAPELARRFGWDVVGSGYARIFRELTT